MESSFEFQKNEKAIWICSNKILFKVTGEDTQGTYSLIEMIVEPQSQVPMHMHTKEDEGLYVIDGELSVNHGQATETISSGFHIFLPKGIPHSYKNIGKKQCRILLFYTPAGFESFLKEIGTEDLANKKEKGVDEMQGIAKRYGVEIINKGV